MGMALIAALTFIASGVGTQGTVTIRATSEGAPVVGASGRPRSG